MRLFRFRSAPEAPPAAADPRPAPRVRPTQAEPVQVQIMGAESLDVLDARDISRTGLGVYVSHGFAGCNISQAVELVITLPRAKPFLARGVIKHRTRRDEPEEYFGIEFTQLSDAGRDKIDRYVAARLEA